MSSYFLREVWLALASVLVVAGPAVSGQQWGVPAPLTVFGHHLENGAQIKNNIIIIVERS